LLIRYVARRVASSIPVAFGVTLITFLLLHAVAGSFVPGLTLNPDMTPQDVERIRHNLGLDQPLPVQYFIWITGLLHGDFGHSLIDGTSVTSEILARLPNTLELVSTSILLALLIAVPLGSAGALRVGSLLDRVITLMSVAGISMPSFWIGLLLILVLSIWLHSIGYGGLPSSGAQSPIGGGDPLDRLAHLAMPATVLTFYYVAIWSRFTRSSMLEALSQEYVKTARAKGLRERRVVFIHALRNAIVPLVTLVGLELPGLFSGAALVEVVFGWPGVGNLALQKAFEYDFTTVLGITTFVSIFVVMGNLVADVLLAILDPRVKYKT